MNTIDEKSKLASVRKKVTKGKNSPVIGATGRRKTSTARVNLVRDKSAGFSINGRNIEEVFGKNSYLTQEILLPFATLTDDIESEMSQFKITVRVKGGGVSGQAGAIAHALSIALVRLELAELGEPAENEQHPIRAKLKRSGLLTRDARKVERKKFGRRKARKREQYSKR
jgi:small subunit ribosomal protein S9